jgi:hypothetical protein
MLETMGSGISWNVSGITLMLFIEGWAGHPVLAKGVQHWFIKPRWTLEVGFTPVFR